MKKNIFTLLFLLGSYFAGAQGFHNNGALISLAAQTLLSVPDSLVNKGTIVNNGDLRISGAWVNLGTYDAGSGEINFDSDLEQTINHSDQSFSKLVISGDGDKTFSANITIESELDLQNSVLKSENGAVIIMNPGATVIGGSDQSHVMGTVEVKGAGDLLFPIGNGTTYLPVEITNVTDPNAVTILTLHDLASGQAISGDKELTKISSKRYWELVFGTGSLNQSKIILPLSNEEGLTDNPDMLVIAGSSNATDAYVSLGQSNVTGNLTSGSLTSELAPTTKYYTLAAISGEHPIEIFNGVSVGDDGKNDFFKIYNIEFFPNNRVTIFNRWGDRVFEMGGYDNDQKSFRGESNSKGNDKLPAGTFFYSIELGDGSPKITGYLEIK
jgi:gliding motility-associated-like protein